MDTQILIRYKSEDAAKLLIGLLGLEILLTAAHICLFAWPGLPSMPRAVLQLLDLNREASLPTWFATVQLSAIGVVLLVAGWISKRRAHFPPSIMILGGFFFLFLSADEGGKIHERIDAVMRGRGMDSLLVFPGGQGGWILVYSVIGFILLSVTGFYLWESLQRTWQRFTRESLIIVGGFTVLMAGAVGLEIIVYIFVRPESVPNLYQLEVAIEEFLEMAGGSIILYATLEIAATLCSERS